MINLTDLEKDTAKELPEVKVVKCRCGNAYCRTYGLNIGTFYQGAGFDEDTANLIARLLNDARNCT